MGKENKTQHLLTLMHEKTQLVFIHGGMTFKTREDYQHYLKTREIALQKPFFWNEDFEKQTNSFLNMLMPRMPCYENAQYEDWKIHFERIIPFLQNRVMLMGVSLGGIFLAKYLSENTFPREIIATYLVCPPFDDTLTNEQLAGGFKLGEDLSRIEQNSKTTHLLFSEDDDIVPVAHADKYRAKLPHANIIIYRGKNGHFNVETFPEIVDLVKQDCEHMRN